MDLLTEEMKIALARKILFTLNFKLLTEEDIFNNFELIILDTNDNKVTRFDLAVEDNKKEMHIIFKRITNGDVMMLYQLVLPEEGMVHKFEVYIEPGSAFEDYLGTVDKICEMVDEKERENQFKKMEESINNLIKF